MINTTSECENEIKSLLTSALPGVDLNDYQIGITGTAEKGDGFLSEVFFVNLTSTIRNYDFVLKCGKSSEILRRNVPIKDAFEHEIHIYNNVFPAFKQFEIERNIVDVFDNVPKCFGTFTWPDKEVIVLQNLKTLGYGLWPKESPLPRNYLEAVLKVYGRWHAISAAMQDQEPENFEKLLNGIFNIWKEFCIGTNFHKAFGNAVEAILKIWENEIDESILNEWKQLHDQSEFYMLNSRAKTKSFNVITHGDCWNNNFMFRATGDKEKSKDVDVIILDWQMSAYSSPVVDVAYFLYTCISEEDLKDFDDLLMIYYDSFAEHLRKLGSNPEKVYTYSKLLKDWKIYGRTGIIHAVLAFPVLCAEKDDIPDMAAAAEKGVDIASGFCPTIKNVDFVKQRSKCIIQHAVERDFIKPTSDF